jgi:DNA-binding CsgD family transcriptional regulator
MMPQRTTPDDSLGAAVARLTPKERECLDPWLAHATAKEIALDLGITHHAVEKRLKSARAKLGVTSTLEAARLVAAAEGYGSTVSHSPELGAAVGAVQQEGSAADGFSGPSRRAFILLGALIMSIVILAAFALTAQPAATPSDGRKVVIVNRKDGTSSTDLSSALSGVFSRLDKNGDKVIAGEELGAGRFEVTRTIIRAGESTPTPAKTSLTDFDKDGDKRVTEAEFLAGMGAITSRAR